MAVSADEEEPRVTGLEVTMRAVAEPVRRALVARYGVEVGTDAAADATAWAWEHRDRVESMDNPAGYLIRVGQTAARRLLRGRRRVWPFTDLTAHADPALADDELATAMARLRPKERVALLMVHGHGFTYRETATLLGISEAAVTNHVHRGLTHVRQLLGEGR